MMMPLPLYEQYSNGRGRAGSEVTVVGVVQREGNEQQEVLALPPPAYHVDAGGEQSCDVGDMAKRMDTERCV